MPLNAAGRSWRRAPNLGVMSIYKHLILRETTMVFVSLIGFVLSFALGVWFFWLVYVGMRGGKIYHTDSTSFFSFKKKPIRFIGVALFFLLLSLMFFYFAVIRGSETWLAIFPQ